MLIEAYRLTFIKSQEGIIYCVSKALQQMGYAEDEGPYPVGKACLIACDAFSALNVTHSSSVNVNAPDKKGASRMQESPVCLPVVIKGVS